MWPTQLYNEWKDIFESTHAIAADWIEEKKIKKRQTAKPLLMETILYVWIL